LKTSNAKVFFDYFQNQSFSKRGSAFSKHDEGAMVIWSFIHFHVRFSSEGRIVGPTALGEGP